MCKAGELDLSYESLISHEARQTLRDLPKTDPTFFAEISQPRSRVPVLSDEERLQEDSEMLYGGSTVADDSDVPLAEVTAHQCDQISGNSESAGENGEEYIYIPDSTGGLHCAAEAEEALTECIGAGDVVIDTSSTVSHRPKRVRRRNALYPSEQFESH